MSGRIDTALLTPEGSPQLRLLQISDLHFGPPFRPEVGEAVLRMAGAIPLDAIIVGGDLTQRAKRIQFEEAKRFLERLPDLPKLVIPGNHDVPLYRFLERMRNPHGLYREIISQELNPVLRVGKAVIAGLDSSAPRTQISNGWVSSEQLNACEAVFREAAADSIRIVVCHHPFIPAPDRLRDRVMPCSSRGIQRIASMGVELILGGHLHRAYIGRTADYYGNSVLTTPVPDRRGEDRSQVERIDSDALRRHGMLVVHSGTATSRRGRGREAMANSLNVIEIGLQTTTVTTWLYQELSGEFAPITSHTVLRP